MTERNTLLSQKPPDVGIMLHSAEKQLEDDKECYSRRCQQVLEALRSRRLKMSSIVNTGPSKSEYRSSELLIAGNAEEGETHELVSRGRSKMDEEDPSKENKAKRSLNVCLLQNNGCVSEGNNLRALKRARRSSSEYSPDTGYDSFDDVVPLQNLRLSDSDDELEEFFHKFSMEQKLSDFDFCVIGSNKPEEGSEEAYPESDTSFESSAPECDNLSAKASSHMSVVLDDQQFFHSVSSKTWLSSTPQRRISPDPSKHFDSGHIISPIPESINKKSTKLLNLQEDLEESIRLEAKSLSIIFQHEARHADSEDENDELYYSDSTEEEDEEEQQINNCKDLLVMEEQCLRNSCEQVTNSSQINSNQHFCPVQRAEMMSFEEAKEERRFSFSPLLPAIITECTDNSFWRLKPRVLPSPLKRPVKAVVPLLEMVRNAKKDKEETGIAVHQIPIEEVWDVENTSPAKRANQELVAEAKSKMIREPTSDGTPFLSLPYAVPRERKFEQLLCPSLSKYIVRTK